MFGILHLTRTECVEETKAAAGCRSSLSLVSISRSVVCVNSEQTAAAIVATRTAASAVRSEALMSCRLAPLDVTWRNFAPVIIRSVVVVVHARGTSVSRDTS